MNETVTVAPGLYAGVREEIGTVGVDAGTMCLATRFPDEDGWMTDAFGPESRNGWSGPGWACSQSGYGDGGYSVAAVTDRGGSVRGVEVVFLFPEADDAAELAARASGLPEPTFEERRAAWQPDADPVLKEKCGAWNAATEAALDAAWDRLLPGSDPSVGAEGHVVTDLTVTDGRIEVGDPCYGSPSLTADVPNGTYRVVAWSVDAGSWGVRTARLGAYLLP